jgi:hypothetical protein
MAELDAAVSGAPLAPEELQHQQEQVDEVEGMSAPCNAKDLTTHACATGQIGSVWRTGQRDCGPACRRGSDL